jgi:hypothetical protein
MVTVLERGNIYFVYRPKVEHTSAAGMQDIQRFFLILIPFEKERQTRGERHVSPARPASEGVYAIARHDDHTHLAFALELPERPAEVQEELNIPAEGLSAWMTTADHLNLRLQHGPTKPQPRPEPPVPSPPSPPHPVPTPPPAEPQPPIPTAGRRPPEPPIEPAT